MLTKDEIVRELDADAAALEEAVNLLDDDLVSLMVVQTALGILAHEVDLAMAIKLFDLARARGLEAPATTPWVEFRERFVDGLTEENIAEAFAPEADGVEKGELE